MILPTWPWSLPYYTPQEIHQSQCVALLDVAHIVSGGGRTSIASGYAVGLITRDHVVLPIETDRVFPPLTSKSARILTPPGVPLGAMEIHISLPAPAPDISFIVSIPGDRVLVDRLTQTRTLLLRLYGRQSATLRPTIDRQLVRDLRRAASGSASGRHPTTGGAS